MEENSDWISVLAVGMHTSQGTTGRTCYGPGRRVRGRRGSTPDPPGPGNTVNAVSVSEMTKIERNRFGSEVGRHQAFCFRYVRSEISGRYPSGHVN